MKKMFEKEPLVSVCVPVYNNEDYIADTMRSVLNQKYHNIELVIVDDNSKDSSLDVIKDASARLIEEGKASKLIDLTENEVVFEEGTENDPANVAPIVDFSRSGIPEVDNEDARVIYLYHNKKNLGMAGNWNRCMELCRGEFIKLICADDLIDPDLIAKEVNLMSENQDVMLVESDTRFVNKEEEIVGKYDRFGRGVMDGKRIAKHSLLTRNYFGAPLANLIRTSAYKQYGGFDPDFSYIIDYEFYMKLACKGSVYVLREPLNYFRVRNDSNTGEVFRGNKGKAYLEEHINLVEKYAQTLGLSQLQKKESIYMRKIMNVLGSLFLRIKL